MKEKKLKLWVKVLLVFIISFSLVTSLFLLYLFIEYQKNKDNELLYSYNINQNIDYKVNLYDNSFIDEKTIASNEMYISELVKNIDVNFNFDYSATKAIDLTYKYKILGNIEGKYQSTSVDNQNGSVWNKEYVLLDEKEEKIDKSNFYISNNIVLDFPTYKKEVELFKKKFAMILSTKMNVKFMINITGKINDQEINDEQTMILMIPLGVQAFSITDDYKKNINKNIHIKSSKKLFPLANIPTIVILFLISIILFITSFKKIFNITEKTEYSKKLEKILKTYNDVIVEIASPINIDDYEIIEVKGIEEMIDLEEELRIPINFYEHIPSYYGEFTLIHNNIAYRYILEEESK